MRISRIPTLRIHPVLLGLLASVAGCEGGGPSVGPSVDSNSNWLIECHTHSDCPVGTGVCMTGICLQPQVFAANPDDQRCIDACEERVHTHLLEPCLSSGEPEDVCSAHANELVATCRANCAALDAADRAPAVTGTLRDPGELLSPEACEGWEPAVFDRADEFIDTSVQRSDTMNCSGASYRRFDDGYGLWVGLVSCGAGYRFYLSQTEEGPYLPAADSSGHGQDLCELVDPSFSIPVDDDITSGGCTTCRIGSNHSFVAGEVFVRHTAGQPFWRAVAPEVGVYQSSVIQCAAGPIECGLSTPLVDCEPDPLRCQ